LNKCLCETCSKILYLGIVTTSMSDRQVLLSQGNLVVIQQLAATDWGLLPFEELVYLNPKSSESALRESLSELVEEEYVSIIQDTETPEDVPSEFYAVTLTAQEDLETMGLWSGIGVLYQAYNAVEKTERISYIREFYPNGPIVEASSE